MEKAEIKLPSESKKWTVAFSLAIIFLIPAVWYINLLTGDLSVPSSWAAITAFVASLLLAVSLSASSFAYFFGWPDMKKGYQKQIGVLAFWVAFLYCIELLLIYPERYFYGFFENFWSADFIFGLAAMAIFGVMTLANSKLMSPYLSWDTIKSILGLGFVAYALLVIRAVFLEWPLWEAWFRTFEGLPTSRFVLSVIAIAVLLLRLAVIMSRRRVSK